MVETAGSVMYALERDTLPPDIRQRQAAFTLFDGCDVCVGHIDADGVTHMTRGHRAAADEHIGCLLYAIPIRETTRGQFLIVNADVVLFGKIGRHKLNDRSALRTIAGDVWDSANLEAKVHALDRRARRRR